MNWLEKFLAFLLPGLCSQTTKREIAEGIHGIPWGITENEAVHAFRRQFGAVDDAYPERGPCPYPDIGPSGIPNRELELYHGRIYGLPIILWTLSFGYSKPKGQHELFKVSALCRGRKRHTKPLLTSS